MPSRAACSSSASFGSRLLRRIREIGKKAVEDIFVPVAEKADLQLLDFRPHRLAAGQHHRNHHQRRVRSRNAVAKIHFRQRLGGQQRDHQRVDDLNRKFAQREHRQSRQRQRGWQSIRRRPPCARSQESTVKHAVNPMMPPR